MIEEGYEEVGDFEFCLRERVCERGEELEGEGGGRQFASLEQLG